MANKKANDTLTELQEAAEAAKQEAMLPSPNLSMGCDLLNLAISDDVCKALGYGRYVWYEGGSSSGKSYLTLSAVAEAARNPEYNEHRLIFFDGERGAGFDLADYFGDQVAERLEVMYPENLERFYDICDDTLDKGKAVMVLDSFDALLPASVEEKIEEDAEKRAKAENTGGSYAMEHGKIHSQRLRRLIKKLHASNSLFIGISQQRDNISTNPYAPKNRTSGGRSLRYWASVQIETQLASPIKKKVDGKDHVIGNNVTINTKKNRISGKSKSVSVRFIHGFGIDNTGSSLEWLADNKYISQSGGRYSSPFYEKAYYFEELAQKIENDNYEYQLAELLQKSWSDLESKLQIARKPRY